MSDNLILYDGVCGLCNSFVQFLIKADSAQVFKFAPLQGATAAAVLQRHADLRNALESVVLVRQFGLADEATFTESEAVLQIVGKLGGAWRLLTMARLFPAFVRNTVYAWIARHRYGWFGRYPECPVPSPETHARFLP